MAIEEGTVAVVARATASAEVDVRYSFTAQHLLASAMFARESTEIERRHPKDPLEEVRIHHRGLIIAAVMQSAAAVEAESAEITLHGPWHHLGSDNADPRTAEFLKPLADLIDRQESLDRYQTILHLLNKGAMPKDRNPWQDMSTLVKLRNELIHYKSNWGREMDRSKFFNGRLPSLHLAPPPFVDCASQNLFPHQILGAACAAWSVKTAVAFIEEVYKTLGIDSPLKPHLAHFAGL
jgi:hypothetical protein